MMSNAPTTSDRWSLESWFSGFGKPDYNDFKAVLLRDIEAMKASTTALGSDTAEIAKTINAIESLSERLGHLSAYLGCLSADDANDEAVKADEAWISTLEAESTKLLASLRSILAALNDEAFHSMLADASLNNAEHTVKRLRYEGQHQMSAEMESLAADLNVNGLHAWGRLYDTLTGKM